MPLLGFCARVCWTSPEALKCSVLNCEWRSVLRQSVVYTSLHHRPVDRGPPNMRKCHEIRKKVQKSQCHSRKKYIQREKNERNFIGKWPAIARDPCITMHHSGLDATPGLVGWLHFVTRVQNFLGLPPMMWAE